MIKNPDTSYLLLSDIGGTNCRFNLTKVNNSALPPSIKSFYFPNLPSPSSPSETPTSNEKSILFNPSLSTNSWSFNENNLEVLCYKTFSSQSFTCITAAIAKFFISLPIEISVPKEDIFLCVSICGPVENQTVKSMSNLGWSDVSGSNLKMMGFKDVFLANDFEAFGYGLARASSTDQLEPLFQGTDLLNEEGKLMIEAKEFGAVEWEEAPKPVFDFSTFTTNPNKKILAVGIGTGVGTVMINSYPNFDKTETFLEVMPSEAGHCFFGFKNQRDIDLVKYIAKVRYKDLSKDYLPFEHLISGLSIPLIYSFLSEGRKTCRLSCKEIFERSLDSKDPLALQTIEYFLDLLGQFIHQVSLCFLPELVVLRGPLLESLKKVLKMKPHLKWNFWRSLLAKSHMGHAYQNMTIFTVQERFNLSALGTVIMFAEKCGH